MTSSLGSRTRSGEISPQVRPNTSTSWRPFTSQLRLQFSRHRGFLVLSDRITFAPHLDATTPGRLTPAPSCRDTTQRSEHSYLTGHVYLEVQCASSSSPPAPSRLPAALCASRDTEPEPQHWATHTSHTVDPEPEDVDHSVIKRIIKDVLHIIIQIYKTDSRHETVCEEFITQLVTDFNTVSWFVWFVSKHSDCWTSGGKQVYQSKLHLNKYTFIFWVSAELKTWVSHII